MENHNNIQDDSLNKSDDSQQAPLSDHQLKQQLSLKKSDSKQASVQQSENLSRNSENSVSINNKQISEKKQIQKQNQQQQQIQNLSQQQMQNQYQQKQNNQQQLSNKQEKSSSSSVFFDQSKEQESEQNFDVENSDNSHNNLRNYNENLERNQSSPQAVDSYLSSRSSISQDEISFRNNPKFYKLAVLTAQNNVDEIQEMLQFDMEIDIVKLVDIKGYSLIHKCCLNSNKELLMIFLNYAKQYQLSKQKEQNKDKVMLVIRDWLNLKEIQEGFTALHLASFKGSLKTIQLLVENGADIYLKSKQGLNVIHLAAQGNQPKSIVYFITKGLSPQILDNKNTSPLHWASFLQSENVVNLLVSTYLNVDLNLQDQDGLTPLHLAAMKGDYKIVRKLLIRGADKNKKDFKGDLPIQCAQEQKFDYIVEMLSDSSNLSQTCNIKPGLLCGLSSIFFLLAWLTNPGYINQGEKSMVELLKLLTIYDDNDICMDCFIVKTPRSRHCEICQKCVSHYDHHCPWINNCVGVNNHPQFLLTTYERFSQKTNMAQSQATEITFQSGISQNNNNNSNRYSYMQIVKPNCNFSNCFKMCYKNKKEYKQIQPYKDDRNASIIIKMQQSSIMDTQQPLLN
ncbi:Ankyrin repeat-containing domain [Pseudocohnilembus persalinus]|uniref:Palmitoyltransferase n=1 Tax=Pseudocohnilembus persalinus TaxID=266149 RepID=A0A0V0QLH0_PSEPJ|nr:Ankyrin repeat-containing domain [Pseudocohnilembus persalinus]|eukprot:KRX03078.1 Ankyrin repeat-containing domain [Pseudocohnilembus persalinus]